MSKNKQAQVFHFDLYGKRQDKYDFLSQQSIDSIQWVELEIKEPNNFFVKKDFRGEFEYEKGFKINEIFIKGAGGIASHRDSLVIDFNFPELRKRIDDFFQLTSEEIKAKYHLVDTDEWQVSFAQKAMKSDTNYTNISYRPFDTRYIYFDDNMITRSRRDLMQHFLMDNLGIVTCKRQENETISFITKFLIDQRYFSIPGSVGKDYAFPLYLYSEKITQSTLYISTERIPNLKVEIVGKIAENLGLQFTNEKEQAPGTFAPIDLLDYIYAVLHSPTYREKYKEFLKIDFPRVPYPKDQDTFWQLVRLGGELRQIHLLESPVVEKRITTYPQTGANRVDKVRFEKDKVWINAEQYFDHVPQVAWDFYIGGYQPAQKWLKDRKGRELSFEDILHYQKIIVALAETDRLMKEIDKIEIE